MKNRKQLLGINNINILIVILLVFICVVFSCFKPVQAYAEPHDAYAYESTIEYAVCNDNSSQLGYATTTNTVIVTASSGSAKFFIWPENQGMVALQPGECINRYRLWVYSCKFDWWGYNSSTLYNGTSEAAVEFKLDYKPYFQTVGIPTGKCEAPCESEKNTIIANCGSTEADVDWTNWSDASCSGATCISDPEQNYGPPEEPEC